MAKINQEPENASINSNKNKCGKGQRKRNWEEAMATDKN